MSKSLGNIIDPLEVIERVGADPLRFGLAWQATEAQNIPFGEEHIDAGRRFANKIWNASRLVLGAHPGGPPTLPRLETLALPERWLLTLFAILMLTVAASMARKRSEPAGDRESRPTVMLGVGFGVGLLTGFLGIGGGFVIVPALLWAGRLPMKVAIGTSLTAIAFSSAAGLLAHLEEAPIDWRLTAEFAGCAGAGMVVGQLGARRVSADRLRQGFALLVAVVGVVILLRQATLLSGAGSTP